MDIKDYYIKLNTALKKIQLAIVAIEAKMTDEYDLTSNYSDMLNTLYNAERYTKKLLNIHKYRGFSKEEYINFSETEDHEIMIQHTVKAWETASLIAKLYNISIEELLQLNNIQTYEITQGTVLNIKVKREIIEQNAVREVPVYGSRVGTKIYGYDLYNDLHAGNDGDFAVIEDPVDTLKQGLKNRLTTRRGDYPLEEDFGISLVGTELPQELAEGMLLVEASEQLLLDERVKDIVNITTERVNGELTFAATVNAVKGIEQVT